MSCWQTSALASSRRFTSAVAPAELASRSDETSSCASSHLEVTRLAQCKHDTVTLISTIMVLNMRCLFLAMQAISQATCLMNAGCLHIMINGVYGKNGTVRGHSWVKIGRALTKLSGAAGPASSGSAPALSCSLRVPDCGRWASWIILCNYHIWSQSGKH